MFDLINAIFLKCFKLILIIFLGIFIHTSYFISTYSEIYNNTILFCIVLVFLYFYSFTIYISIIALYKKFEKTYFYNIFLGPIFPTLFVTIQLSKLWLMMAKVDFVAFYETFIANVFQYRFHEYKDMI